MAMLIWPPCRPARFRLTNGNPNQIVAFVYPYGNGPYGNGHVFDTPIPLDYCSASQMTSITSAEVQTLFGNPQYGMELANPICFGRQTQIATPSGARPVESLQVGDLVVLRTLNRRALQEIAILFPDIRLSDPLCPLARPTVLPILNRALRPENDARPLPAKADRPCNAAPGLAAKRPFSSRAP